MTDDGFNPLGTGPDLEIGPRQLTPARARQLLARPGLSGIMSRLTNAELQHVNAVMAFHGLLTPRQAVQRIADEATEMEGTP